MKQKIKIEKIVCKDCDGSGLYKGFAEGNKSAVVCRTCDGKGWVNFEFEYEIFEKRKIRKGVKRVFDGSYGYGITDEDYVDEKTKKVYHFSQYGATYREWLNGKIPIPMKELYCPYLWKNTGVGNEPLKKCKTHVGSLISNCEHFENKLECWEEYEETHNPDYLMQEKARVIEKNLRGKK